MKNEPELVSRLMSAGVAGIVVLEGMYTLAAQPAFQDLSPAVLADCMEPRLVTYAEGASNSSSCSHSSCGSSCSSSCGGGCGGCGGGD